MAEPARIIEQVWTLDAFRMADFGDRRAELIDGHVVIDHAAPSPPHGQLVVKLGRAFDEAVERGGLRCQVEAGSGIDIERGTSGLERDYSLVPDVLVRCRPDPDRPAEPAVVIEVLSPSNTASDLLLKLRAYMAVPGVMHILVVHQDRHLIHHHRRAADGSWASPSTLAGPDAILRIDALGVEVPLATLYRNVLPPDAD